MCSSFFSEIKKRPGLLNLSGSEFFEAYKPEQDQELIENIYQMLMRSWLLGLRHTQEDRHGDLEELDSDFADINLSFDLPYEEAVKIAGLRISLTPEQFKKISDDLKAQAFTIGRLSQIDLIEKVKDAYVKQLNSSDMSVKNFIKDAIEISGEDVNYSYYFDLVFRTNLQKDYNAAKAWDITNDPPQFLQFVGIEDERQSDICRVRSGIILPATDPFWDDNWPPLHYNCRSTIREIMGTEAEELAKDASENGKKSEMVSSQNSFKERLKKAEEAAKKGTKMQVDPSSGWGRNPVKNNAFWGTTPEQLNRIARAMIQEELNGMYGETICKDFKEQKTGFVTQGRSKGGVRYPEGIEKESEFANNLKAAEVLADNGFYVELQKPIALQNNRSWDGWLNGVDKIELKAPTSSSKATLETRILDGYDRAQSVVVTLSSDDQIESLKRIIKGDIPKKAKERTIKQLIVIKDKKMVQLTSDDLLKNLEATYNKLDSLI